MRFESMLYNIEVNRETTIIKKRELLRKIEKKEAKENVYTQALVRSMAKAENSETHDERRKKTRRNIKSAKRANQPTRNHFLFFSFPSVVGSFNNV